MNRNKRIKENKPMSMNRQWFVFACFLLLSFGLIARAFHLQVVTKDYLQKEGNARFLRSVDVKANRGRIVDRRNEFLAVSTPVDSIWIHPGNYLKEAQDSSELLRLLNIDKASFEAKVLANKDKGFVYLKRHLPPQKAAEILSLDIEGIYAQREYRRFYPGGTAAGHVVGFTNIDEKGQEGIELMYNDELVGVDGQKYVLRDRRGNIVESVQSIKDDVDGQDLTLSIDMRLQYITYQSLNNAVLETKADSASAIIVDPYTGEILALANVPSFNPNNRSEFNPSNFRNRGVTDSYEPGSTIKPFTVAFGLESGKITKNTQFNTNPGSVTIGRNTISDTHNYGVIDTTRVISKSSNVGVTQIAMMFEAKELRDFFAKMGFGEKSGAGIPGETSASLPNRKKWRPIEHATIAYGYGLSSSILQLARAYSILANGGYKVPLTLTKAAGPVEGEQVISKEVTEQVRLMMEEVVGVEGTARRAEMDEYTAGGKTGTARKVIDGKYSQKEYIASFAGFAPAIDPRLVMVVMVDNPKSKQYYGGVVAAPVFKEVMAKSLRLYNVQPDKLEELNIQKLSTHSKLAGIDQ